MKRKIINKTLVRTALVGLGLWIPLMGGMGRCAVKSDGIQFSTTKEMTSMNMKKDTLPPQGREREKNEPSDAQKDESAKMNEKYVTALAQQFQVPPITIEEMRNMNQGWGEIQIQLSMAQYIAKTDPKLYPTFHDALVRVEAMRKEGKGYGQIAEELGFELGPVVSVGNHHLNGNDRFKEEARESRKVTKEAAKAARKASKEDAKENKEEMKEIQKEAKEDIKESRRDFKEGREEAKERSRERR